ncbi:hypothetical protein PCAR4_400127 [Paraburkholderia caribensis]|nr:hypothetical protein PCAR4_400127 [Paraburkholderia caribensis]
MWCPDSSEVRFWRLKKRIFIYVKADRQTAIYIFTRPKYWIVFLRLFVAATRTKRTSSGVGKGEPQRSPVTSS